jgi:NAD(P)H-dependent FMN reductase
MFIPIILGSTRRGRQSAKVAKFILDRLGKQPGVETELLDLADYNFPIMEERLRARDDPPPRLQEFSDKLARADAVVIVTPEYNNGYPGVLKNALDYLVPEYRRKAFGIVTVSAGGFGGLNAMQQLRQVVLALGAYPIPAQFPVSKVRESFADDGTPQDESYEKRVAAFFDEFLWAARALTTARKPASGG